MNMLNELLALGFHDTKIEKMIVDILTNKIQFFLNVIVGETRENEQDYNLCYRKGILTFENVSFCEFVGEFDFRNTNIILSGKIDESGCNIFLTSNQKVIIKAKEVLYSWID